MRLNIAAITGVTPARIPLPEPRVLEHENAETSQIIIDEVRAADANLALDEAILDRLEGIRDQSVTDPEQGKKVKAELSALVDDDFPFDPTQLEAVRGMLIQQYAAMTGAAGTGKTTTVKKFVQTLLDTTNMTLVDMTNYWKRGGKVSEDPDDDYETPEDLIPSIAMVSFTGRATQMIKKNFPRDWHGNIMTIHRLLGFYPEFYEDWDDDRQEMVNKRRFVPTYNRENKVPFKIIIVDEAGMLGTELARQLFDALEDDCRVYMIGDINQLPPTHGKSIFGFAMSNWPTWELTHVHRQKGKNNSIVDNAHRILNGQKTISDCNDSAANFKTKAGMMAALNWMVRNKDWKFAMFEVDEDSRKAAGYIRTGMEVLKNRIYQPNRDAFITPINGFEPTANGASLGQDPMNRELAVALNRGAERYFIDGGRDKKNFAVGDKVMATRNDYETGITNGMTGVIEDIIANGMYEGNVMQYGKIGEVQEYAAANHEDEGLVDLAEMMDYAANEEDKKDREKAARGHASHIITVKFGEGEHAFTIQFGTFAEVASLQLAYAMTCHKMQGGEAPFIMFVVHQSHKRPLCREWGYTAQTRAAGQCVMFYTKQGLGTMLSKQVIKGKNLKEKIAAFQALQKVGPLGAQVNLPWLPKANQIGESLEEIEYDWQPPEEGEPGEDPGESETVSAPVVYAEIPDREVKESPAPRPIVINVKNLSLHIAPPRPVPTPQTTRDGGDLKAEVQVAATTNQSVVKADQQLRLARYGNAIEKSFQAAAPRVALSDGSHFAAREFTRPEITIEQQGQAMLDHWKVIQQDKLGRLAGPEIKWPAPKPPEKKMNPLQLLILKQARKGK